MTVSQRVPQAAPSSASDIPTRKIARRLIPFLCLLYFFAYLDRFNIGFASITMNQDLGLSMAAYGFAASMFFVGYILFEVPSNIVLGKVGARLWITRIMVTWGLVSAATIFTRGPGSLAGLRLLLGAAEAGFLPGIVVYLSQWFPHEERSGAMGMFQTAMPLAGVLGSPVSALILTHMHGVSGLPGWKWLFLIQGLPSVALGLSCLWLLPSRPAEAKWLTDAQRASLERKLEAERRATEAGGHVSLRQVFVEPRVVMLAVLLFCLICGSTGIGFFLPQIVKDFGFSTVKIGMVTAIPYLASVVGMVLWSRFANHKDDRIRYVAIPTVLAGCGFLLAACSLHTPVVAVIGLSVACVGIFSTFPVYFTLPQTFLTGTSAAAAIAFVNSVGNISGVVEPAFIGWTRDVSGGFTFMLFILAGLMAVALVLCWRFAAMVRSGAVASPLKRQSV
ncbi:MFS transporter [Paraburkholderia sp. ZP32-5]|uniref:MFS transporter n=1 Tax=Paraburkholderia sp. ZP32-5 TaxID=2883245 RepID=UPI001F2C4D3F|nr:MFS transporter [Paraburkholderia sp. ZP32-5]